MVMYGDGDPLSRVEVMQGRLTRRQIVRQSAALGLSLPVVASLLAACGGDDEADPTATQASGTGSTSGAATATQGTAGGSTSASPGTSGTSGTPAATRPAGSPTVQAKKGGTLVVALEADPQNFDPAYTAVAGRRVGRAIYDALVDVSLDGEIVPGLVDKWEVVDNKTFVFHARSGVKFHDGSDFNGETIKFHFERHFDADVKSLRRSELGSFDKAEMIDPMTCRVTMKEPFIPLLAALFDWSGFVISPAAWEQHGKDNYLYNPSGTGPFKFVSYTKDLETKVERNPNYWRNPEQPYLDAITFRAIPTASTRLTELRAGGAHVAETLPFQDIDRLKATPEIVVSEAQGFRWDAFMFNSKSEIGQNKAFRQAFNWVIDRDAIQKVVYFDTGKPGFDPYWPNTPYHDPNYKPFTRDVNKAKALIQQSGLQTPIRFTCLLYQDAAYEKAAQVLQANLAEIGVEMSIEVHDIASVLQDFQAANYEFGTTWWGWRPDPDGGIYPKFYSKGSQNYYGYYNNPQADQLMDQTRAETDQAKRIDLFRDLADVLNDDAVFIFYHYGSDIKGLSPKVKGFVHYSDSMTRYHEMWLD